MGMRFLKARYFPHTSFLEAKQGHCASWGWASLLEGRNIIMGGAHWQVMNGKNIKFWVDQWLPKLPAGHLSPLAGVQID